MYAELVCRSNYSFLQGASHAEELVNRAAELGLSALSLTDGDGLYGSVKAHQAAKTRGLKFILGTTLTLTDGPPLCVYAENGKGYAHLCELISFSRLGHSKGRAGLSWQRVAERNEGLFALLPGGHSGEPTTPIASLAEAFRGRFYVGVSRSLDSSDEKRVLQAQSLGRHLGVSLIAHNDVHTHVRERQPLQDVLTAIRHSTTVSAAGTLLFPNAERTLKSPAEMARLFSDLPEAVGASLEIAQACTFTFDEFTYDFGQEQLPPGLTRDQFLEQLVETGLHFRYPQGIPEAVRAQIRHELALITKLDYAGYFLTMWDIMRFARAQGILCQGRGSAANSSVCYVLEITAVDPVAMGLLFERFLSEVHKEPPDIDVDFEHERREEVIQYVYAKHGRHRAAMVAEHICFRSKLALRQVGHALGLSLDQVDRVARSLNFVEGIGPYQLHQAGLSASDLAVQQTMVLAKQLEGMPRHLSIHTGGFVITHRPLVSLAPVENGAMEDRTVVQWEKDDVSALGLMKVDLLGLGMLTVVSRTFELVAQTTGQTWTMATIPQGDPKVYDMLCEGDSIGTFQVESRAQQNMLPRLKPRKFYDLVIQVAIIRPGPIVGGMVHPFLRRRNGEEPVTYPSEAVRSILERTLGIPLFQEQMMRLSIVAAGFTADRADQLRRTLNSKRAIELLPMFEKEFIDGCLSRGYPQDFAQRCFESFRGFAHYGFPESHAASFALIAYVSSWLKCHYPAAFCAALLDAQPMGFYAPHTLVDDARRHGVDVRPIDINISAWTSTLEPVAGAGPALRLGFQQVKGVKQAALERLLSVRAATGPFTSLADVARRTHVPRLDLTRLALAGAFNSLCHNRRNALWDLHALGPFDADDLFFGLPMAADRAEFPEMSRSENVYSDYEAVGLSLESHPVGLLRGQLKAAKAITAQQLSQAKAGDRVRLGGLVIVRQRPPTAKGFCFLSVEDETGIANLVIEPQNFERYRREITGVPMILGSGRVERNGKVVNLKIDHLEVLMPREQGPQFADTLSASRFSNNWG